nr:hypothetical protein [Tanacetum cinerariifolium]
WDLDKLTWEGRVGLFGSVQVVVRCTGKLGEGMGCLAGKMRFGPHGLLGLASTPLNENCSAVLFKKLPEKLRDPDKFLILYDFSKLVECLALADIGASINLMPHSVWKKLSLLELTPTRMTLKLANRSVAYPVGVAEDVFVKVGKFYFPADFVVVDYDVDPRVPLILERPFLRTTQALIDVHGEELTLRVNDEAITFKDPIIATSSPSFTPFERSDFILEEIETFVRTSNELFTLDDDCDPERNIALIEKLLNEDPYLNLPSMKNEDLNKVDVTMTKPSIKEPSELKLKDLQLYLEYAFLEETDKLPVIISKELKDEEKAALLKDDFKPAVQHQRRVNPKIHEVIKKEVIKLLDAGMIYPISDSPWEKCHFMVKEGIVLGHKISKSGIEVDRAKVNVIAKLPHPTSVKGKVVLNFIKSAKSQANSTQE